MKINQKLRNLITDKSKQEIAFEAKDKARAFVKTDEGIRLLRRWNVLTPAGELRERRNLKFAEALLPLFPGITGMVAEQLYRELLSEQQDEVGCTNQSPGSCE